MANTSHSTAPVFVSVFTVICVCLFVGSLNLPPYVQSEAVRSEDNQQVISIELDELAVSLGRKEPFVLKKLPQSIRELEGKRIRIRGYMYPTFEETGIVEFCLNGETRSKSYNWGAGLEYVPIHYYIEVFLQDGLIVDYDGQKPFIVEGTLRINPNFNRGELITLFRIEDATLRATTRRDGYHSAIGFLCWSCRMDPRRSQKYDRWKTIDTEC